MGIYDIATATLGSAVGAGASFNINYPSGRSRADYFGGVQHMIVTTGLPTLFALSRDFSLVFGASNITVTMISGLAIAANTVVNLHLDRGALDPGELPLLDLPANVSFSQTVWLYLGTPTTAVAAGFFASQNLTALGVASVSTTVAAAIAAASLAGVADVGRNVVAAWTGTAVITVTGRDFDGNLMVESSASGTSFVGKKAFKTVINISVSADVTALTVGTGAILGLPIAIESPGNLLKELQSGALATAGVLVGADANTPTALTGDVRGTYTPNSAPNGGRRYELLCAARSAYYKGGAQFAG